jgi:hypothetical protein
MKAVLEFNYPEDEEKLLYAVKGPQMYKALVNIKLAITNEFKHKADLEDVLDRVRELTNQILTELDAV